jgi:hypothetical protein
MKNLVLLSVTFLLAVGTTFANDGVKKLKKHKRAKYHQCDAYKTQYKPIKQDRHRSHGLCDAYN